MWTEWVGRRRGAALLAAMLIILGAAPASALHKLTLHNPPPNDDFASARGVGTLPYADTVDVGDASEEAGEPEDCFYAESTVWYRYVAPADADISFIAEGSDAPLFLAVYRGTSLQGLSLVACPRSSGWGWDFVTLGAEVSAGETYYLQGQIPTWAGDTRLTVRVEVGGSISGTARDAVSGAGIGGICAYLLGARQEPALSQTEADGAFAFHGVTPGLHGFEFLDCTQGAYFYGALRDVEVARGQHLTGVDVTLRRGARVFGGLTETSGSPVEGECVAVLTTGGAEVASGRSGADGSYRLGPIHTGTYKVRFGCPTSDTYLTSFYDGRSDLALADPLSATEGSDITGIDGAIPRWGLPRNDDIADAADASTLPFSDDVSARLATVQAGEPLDCGGTLDTIWYRFTTDREVNLTARAKATNYSFVPSVAVYETSPLLGSDPRAFARVACSYQPPPFYNYWNPEVFFIAQPGLVYYVQVGRFAQYTQINVLDTVRIGNAYDHAGRVSVELFEERAPANDLRADAMVVGSLPFSRDDTLRKATVGADDAPSTCVGGDGSVWYRYEAQAGGTLTAVASSGYGGAAHLAVFRDRGLGTGIGAADLEALGCDDDYYRSTVTFDAGAGDVLWFQISGFVNGDTEIVPLRYRFDLHSA